MSNFVDQAPSLRRARSWPALIACGAIVLLSVTVVHADVATWGGGNGVWNNPLAWSGGVVPKNDSPMGAVYDVFIDSNPALASNVTVPSFFTINGLTLNLDDTITIADGGHLTANGGMISGDIVGMGTSGFNYAAGATATNIGTIASSAGATFSVSPSILNQTSGTSSGLLLATGVGATMNVGGGTINGGILRAESQTTLNINSVVNNANIDTTGGAIVANGTYTGCTFTNNGAGSIAASASFTNCEFAGNTTTSLTTFTDSKIDAPATLTAVQGSSTKLIGTLTNNGNYVITSDPINPPKFSFVYIHGDVNINGSGKITLQNNAAIASDPGPRSLTIGLAQTIQGSGKIGDTSLPITNAGTINANVPGATLTVVPDNNAFNNTGTLKASGGGVLSLSGGVFANALGKIECYDNSQIQFGGTFSGGTVTVVGPSGTLFASATTFSGVNITGNFPNLVNAFANGATFNNSSVTGDIYLPNSRTIGLGGASFTLNGNLSMNSTGGNTILNINNDMTLSGNATLSLSNNSSNIIRSIGAPLPRLTIAPGVTIQGSGQLGEASSNGIKIRLTNQGTLIANQATSLIVSVTTGAAAATDDFINAGTIQANAADTFRVNGNFTQIAGGTITGGGIFTNALGAFYWQGGSINGANTGVFNANGGINISGNDSKTFAGWTINNNGATTWSGNGNILAGSGAVFVNPAARTLDLQSDAGIAFSGNGLLATINNSGTFKKSGGAGTSVLAASVNNTNGIIDVAPGLGLQVNGTFSIPAANTLTKNNTGTLILNGAQNYGAGATMKVNAGAVNFNTDAGGNLTINVDPSTINIGANNTIQALNLIGGSTANVGNNGAGNVAANLQMATLTSQGAAAVNTLNVTLPANSANVSTTFNILGGGTFTKSGPGELHIDGAQAHAAGALLDLTGGTLRLDTDGLPNLTLRLGAGTTSTFGANQTIADLRNLGGVAAAVQVFPGFNVAPGTFEINGGTITVGGGGTLTLGTQVNAAGSTLAVNDATVKLNTNVTHNVTLNLGNNANVVFNAAQELAALNAAPAATSAIEFHNVSATGPIVIGAGATLNLSGDGTLGLGVQNHGAGATMNINSGTVVFGPEVGMPLIVNVGDGTANFNANQAPATLAENAGKTGTVNVADTKTLTPANLNIAAGGRLVLNGPGAVAAAAQAHGAGAILSDVSAPLTLTQNSGNNLTLELGNVTASLTSNQSFGGLNVLAGATGTIDTAAMTVTGPGIVGIGAGAKLRKTGSGVLSIGPMQNSPASVLQLDGGQTFLFNDAGTALTVNANSATTFNVTQHLNALNLTGAPVLLTAGPAPNSKSIVTPVLKIDGAPGAWNGTLNLTNNAALIDYPTAGPSPLATIRSQITSGYNGGAWSGTGITSTSAAAEPATALGYAEASEVLNFAGGADTAPFVGQLADKTTALVRYTLLGDANLDGKVDFADLVALAQSYNATVSSITDSWWSHGDFNYDGVVNFPDLVKLAQNYNAMLTAPPTPATVLAQVPEPTSLVMLVAAACSLAVRRPRRAVVNSSRND